MAHYRIDTKGDENLGQGLARELEDFLRGFRPDMRTAEGKALREARELSRRLRGIIDRNDGFKNIL